MRFCKRVRRVGDYVIPRLARRLEHVYKAVVDCTSSTLSKASLHFRLRGMRRPDRKAGLS